MGNIELVTIIVVAINGIVSFKGFNDQLFFDKYKFSISGIQRGEYWRMLTSGFLHVDITHLFVNMLTLYFFANVVIFHGGLLAFVLTYIGSLLLGNLFTLYFRKNEPYYSAVGASGAVMGILYSAILLRPDMTLGLMFIIPLPAYVFGIGYLLYSIYGMKAQNDQIGHDAHFGGAMGGYFITMFFAPWVFTEHLWMVALLFIPIVVLFILKRMGKI